MRAVNLIPSDQRRGPASGPARSEGGAYAVLALLGGLAILALLYGIAQHQISSRQAKAASIATRTQTAKAAAAQLAPYTSFIALREQRVQAVSQLVDSRFDWPHALHELGRVLPADASISLLSGTIGSATGAAATASTAAPSSAAAPSAAAPSAAASSAGSASTAGSSGAASSAAVVSATPPGSLPVFTLSGCATSQAEVALTLERLRLIDGVSEVTLQSSTKSSSSGSAGGSGQCPPGDPAFSVQVSFDPLPTSSTATPPLTTTGSSATALTTAQGGTR
jgi:hypothetical protein